ncbi:FAD-binding oxidoreductase [Agaricicola taiwanensis]|uniref:FAD-binding oxidoreductase n=1 Tax=Agaricicola taiwanensis TaxID=591372 RepID=A0A8J2YBB2_9RHOB|nr:FAD-binding oxidoreductase [Agaricicola taiwanensis]GGE32205.1 FAD-binding oxidoreductase [Agaricicola taiwanensis]
MSLFASDVAIVGGGLIGSSAALALRRLGFSVVLIERDLCGARASGVNFGGVRRQGRSIGQLHLAMRAHAIWQRLPELIGTDGEYVQSGHLKLARSPQDLAALAEYRERTSDFDLKLEILEGAEFRRRFPMFGEGVAGGSLSPEDGQANPRLVAPAFARAAASAGVIVLERCHLTSMAREERSFLLRAEAGVEIRAQHLINAAGGWGHEVASHFGDHLPLKVGYPTMAVTEPLPAVLGVSLGVEGGGFYARQVARGNLVMGGGFGEATGPGTSRPGRRPMASVAEQAAAILPALRHAQVIRFWSGTEGYTPDKNPVIDFSPTTSGLIHAFGFSGGGFQIAPAVGEVLAELVRDGTSTTPLDSFRINRFNPHPMSEASIL